MLAALCAMDEATLGGKEAKDELESLRTRYELLSVPEACEIARHAKVDRVFEQTEKKLTLGLSDPDYEVAVVKALARVGSRKFGKAPTSHLERELQPFSVSS